MLLHRLTYLYTSKDAGVLKADQVRLEVTVLVLCRH